MADQVSALQAAQEAKDASAAVAACSAAQRSRAIEAAASALEAHSADIVAANAQDMARGRENGMSEPLLDRLFLDEGRIRDIAAGMRAVASQADPVGEVVSGRTLDSGVRLTQLRVPMGVVAAIYEARPNVTADIAALALRAGNACVLRGGSAAALSCEAMVEALREGVAAAGLPAGAVTYVSKPGREQTSDLMRANGLVDVLIPRGGASLIQACVQQATVPVIETGVGNCHLYLERTADPECAVNIAVNAKTQRPGVCNAIESLLVDRDAAPALLPPVCAALADRGVELVGDADAREALEGSGITMGEATEQDWDTEYLALKISVACVDGVDEAIAHINAHGTHHSECIVTCDYEAGERFLAGVDAAAVYVNASTRFTDGGMFGLGAEVGISTQKLHARGPMGATALTTTKYLLRGEGQVR